MNRKIHRMKAHIFILFVFTGALSLFADGNMDTNMSNVPIIPDELNSTASLSKTVIPSEDDLLKPMVEKLLKELAIKYSLFEDLDKNLSNEPLTNKEINSIFFTFSAEKEKMNTAKKELERKLKEAKKLKKKKAQALPTENKYTNLKVGQTPIYPRNKNKPLFIGPGKLGRAIKIPVLDKPKSLPNIKPEIKEVIIPSDFYITGINCYMGTCVAYTEEKVLRVGDKLFGEKILSITKNGIKIKNKKIPFN